MSVRDLAIAWRNEPVANITRAVADRCDRAFQLPDSQMPAALDFNARLVTELHKLGIWPYRGTPR